MLPYEVVVTFERQSATDRQNTRLQKPWPYLGYSLFSLNLGLSPLGYGVGKDEAWMVSTFQRHLPLPTHPRVGRVGCRDTQAQTLSCVISEKSA